MNIGFLVLDFVAPFCNSLKDKRMIVRSLRDKLTKRFNVAFAEVGEQDKYQRLLIALVTIANTPERVQTPREPSFSRLRGRCFERRRAALRGDSAR